MTEFMAKRFRPCSVNSAIYRLRWAHSQLKVTEESVLSEDFLSASDEASDACGECDCPEVKIPAVEVVLPGETFDT